jgi:hypothetical protein
MSQQLFKIVIASSQHNSLFTLEEEESWHTVAVVK